MLHRASFGPSVTVRALSELSPEESAKRPRHASRNRGLTMLTAHAPTNAVSVAPTHSHFTMPQRMDLLRANTAVATRPDGMYAHHRRRNADPNWDVGKKHQRRHKNNTANSDASDHQAGR